MRNFVDRKLTRQISAVMSSPSDNFIDIVKAAKLNPKTDFVDADLRGIDLSGLDLREFEFTGANLEGANTSGTTFSPGFSPELTAKPIQENLFSSEVSNYFIYYNKIVSQKRAYKRVAEIVAMLCETKDKSLILDVIGSVIGIDRSIIVHKVCKQAQELISEHGQAIYVPMTIAIATKYAHFMDRRRMQNAIRERCGVYPLVHTYLDRKSR